MHTDSLAAEASSETLGQPRSKRERTRMRLIEAAKQILASRGPEAGVAEITDLADLAVGSFYNYYSGKEELFEVAANEAVTAFEQFMFESTASLSDPVEVLSARIRLFGRSSESHELAAHIMVRTFSEQLGLHAGYRPGAMDDLHAAMATGRVAPKHPEAALSAIVASGVSLLARRLADPSIGPRAVDDYTETMLVMIGLGQEEAEELAHGPLPTSGTDNPD